MSRSDVRDRRCPGWSWARSPRDALSRTRLRLGERCWERQKVAKFSFSFGSRRLCCFSRAVSFFLLIYSPNALSLKQNKKFPRGAPEGLRGAGDCPPRHPRSRRAPLAASGAAAQPGPQPRPEPYWVADYEQGPGTVPGPLPPIELYTIQYYTRHVSRVLASRATED